MLQEMLDRDNRKFGGQETVLAGYPGRVSPIMNKEKELFVGR
jgi:hypothetical protein